LGSGDFSAGYAERLVRCVAWGVIGGLLLQTLRRPTWRRWLRLVAVLGQHLPVWLGFKGGKA